MVKILFCFFCSLALLPAFSQPSDGGEITYETTFRNATNASKMIYQGAKAKYSSVSSNNTPSEIYFSDAPTCVLGWPNTNPYEIKQMILGEGIATQTRTSDTMTILGFLCRKVVVKNVRDHVYEIWYTTDLPFKASPIPALWTEGVVLALLHEQLKIEAKSFRSLVVAHTAFVLPENTKLVKEEDPTQTKRIRQ